jgi:hypothetical protein
MLLVALAMIAIIAMAALSIDVITLYLAREEAQRSADAAALAAARVISLSGITSDPNNSDSTWGAICSASGSATQAAHAVATQGAVGGAAGTVTVTYTANGDTESDCTAFPTPGAFGVNPIVNVQVQRLALPTFFSRIWGNTGNSVTATAAAEAFNPSNSGNVGNVVTGTITPVQPRCVKPWIIPNLDPRKPNTSCTNACQALVSPTDGHVMNDGTWPTGIAGERFLMIPDCRHNVHGSCSLRSNPIRANYPPNFGTVPNFPNANLEYLPGQTLNPSVAVPAGASGDLYEEAIAGCDQTTVYYCGVPSSSPVGSGPNRVDLGTYPADDTSDGVAALINEGNVNSGSQPTGQDYFNPYGTPTYPLFSSTSGSQILAGSRNPLVVKAGLTSGAPLTASNSIATVPIFDQQNNPIAPTGTSRVTIVGFLQFFINGVDQYGNLDVTVLNAAGCSRDATGTAVAGSSPVPVRLITPP